LSASLAGAPWRWTIGPSSASPGCRLANTSMIWLLPRTRPSWRGTRLRAGRWPDLDNHSGPIVHLHRPGEVADRAEDGRDDLVGGRTAVRPHGGERALHAE